METFQTQETLKQLTTGKRLEGDSVLARVIAAGYKNLKYFGEPNKSIVIVEEPDYILKQLGPNKALGSAVYISYPGIKGPDFAQNAIDSLEYILTKAEVLYQQNKEDFKTLSITDYKTIASFNSIPVNQLKRILARYPKMNSLNIITTSGILTIMTHIFNIISFLIPLELVKNVKMASSLDKAVEIAKRF